MKPNILILIVALFAVLVLMVSCASNPAPPQVQAYQTIGQIDTEATSLIEGMDDAVIQRLIPTNDVPKASQAYNDLHQALIFASETAQQGTNAIAPQVFQTNLFNLTMIVGQIMAQKH